ncbi:MAG TPA: quinoprotein relay system zinc metallohydrolase 2 [Methylophilaceae bacterium]
MYRSFVLMLFRVSLCSVLFCATVALAEPLPVIEVAPGVFVHQGVHEDLTDDYHGDIANIGFVVGKSAVAVIDTGGTLAVGKRLREAVRQVTDLPIAYVINTHVHPDHIYGDAAFLQDNPKFVGHFKLADAMELRRDMYQRNNLEVLGKAFAGSEIVKPTLPVKDTLELDLGNRVLQLKAWSPAHTNTDLTVFDTSSQTLWTGDLLFIERTPSMDGDTRNWLKLIPQLKAIPAKMVIPGHGTPTAQVQQAFDREQHYFEVILADIRASIKKGETMESTMDHAAASEKDSWVLFSSVNRRNINLLYPQLEWE